MSEVFALRGHGDGERASGELAHVELDSGSGVPPDCALGFDAEQVRRMLAAMGFERLDAQLLHSFTHRPQTPLPSPTPPLPSLPAADTYSLMRFHYDYMNSASIALTRRLHAYISKL